MAEDRVRPDQKWKVTIEFKGPKEPQDVQKLMAELQKVAKSQGFELGTPWKEPT